MHDKITVKDLIQHLQQFDQTLVVGETHDCWYWFVALRDINIAYYKDTDGYLDFRNVNDIECKDEWMMEPEEKAKYTKMLCIGSI